MMDPRPGRGATGVPGVLGVLGAGLLFAALAGCGSGAASSGAASSGAASSGAAAATAATATTPPAVPPAGCASVNQATANPISGTYYRQAAQVRALFGQLCAAVTHPAQAQMMHCPADIGTDYIGTFYDGSRVLATFTYAASGCERVSVTAAGKTLATMVYGRAAAAAPQLATDLAAIMGAQKPGVMQPQGGAAQPG